MRRAMRRRRHWAAVLVSCLVLASAVPAKAEEQTVSPSPAPEVLTLEEAARLLRIEPGVLEELAKRNEVPARRLGSRWRFNRDTLLAWLNGDWKLITTAVPPEGNAIASESLSHVKGTGTTLAQNEASDETGEESRVDEGLEQKEPIGEAPEERTAEEVFLRGQKVLLAPGEVTLDTGLFYSQSDAQQLALVSGGVGLATIEEETFTALLIGRVGVLEETELFASSSLRDQQSHLFFGSQRLSETERTEFGDVRLGIRRTLLHEAPGIPDVIVTLDGRIPTGHTSYAVGGGLALVKSFDPAVLFASTNYRHTFSEEFSDVTRLEPEDRIDATVGYALALNDTLTASTSVSGLYTSETDFANAKLRQRDSFSMQFGLTSWLAEGLYVEPSVSFDLGGPGDSFALGVSVPYTFTP